MMMMIIFANICCVLSVCVWVGFSPSSCVRLVICILVRVDVWELLFVSVLTVWMSRNACTRVRSISLSLRNFFYNWIACNSRSAVSFSFFPNRHTFWGSIFMGETLQFRGRVGIKINFNWAFFFFLRGKLQSVERRGMNGRKKRVQKLKSKR